jgi:hypothetical protein
MVERFTLTGRLRCLDCGAEDDYRWTLLTPNEIVTLHHPGGPCTRQSADKVTP